MGEDIGGIEGQGEEGGRSTSQKCQKKTERRVISKKSEQAQKKPPKQKTKGEHRG